MTHARRISILILAFLFVLSFSSAGWPALTGVVVLYGKGGTTKLVTRFMETLRKAGFMVIVPDLPYSEGNWEKPYQDNVAAVDKAITALKKQGVTRVFLAGHSLGANVAPYVATQLTVDGVVAMGAGHVPEAKGYASRVSSDMEKARRMVAQGKADTRAVFDDYDQGQKLQRKATAAIYLSYVDPEGPAVMPRNAAVLTPGTALLWVVGTRDNMSERGSSYVFDKVPPHPRNKYLVVDSDHANVPTDAAEQIVAWLKEFDR
ncbi:MAG TPA: alpha/beta hydrolase [Syntrophorhabdaceae bacterium]|nr:alpha/beta hydrolase [Syntrophorhabdaceae bacterium]